METDIRYIERRNYVPASREGTEMSLALRHRLAIAVIVAGVTLWIRVVELTPGASRRSSRERCSCGMTHR